MKLDLSNTIKKDFAGIIDEIGESITLNRATKTTSNLTGDRTVSFGSDVIIMQLSKLIQNNMFTEKKDYLKLVMLHFIQERQILFQETIKLFIIVLIILLKLFYLVLE